jgi:hypothetical protein
LTALGRYHDLIAIDNTLVDIWAQHHSAVSGPEKSYWCYAVFYGSSIFTFSVAGVFNTGFMRFWHFWENLYCDGSVLLKQKIVSFYSFHHLIGILSFTKILHLERKLSDINWTIHTFEIKHLLNNNLSFFWTCFECKVFLKVFIHLELLP